MPTSFLSLSAELRNLIYDMAIGDVTESWVNHHGRAAEQPAFLRSCRQVRNEALPMYEARCYSAMETRNYRVHALDFTHLLPIFVGTLRQQFLTCEGPEIVIHLSRSTAFDWNDPTIRANLETWLRHWGTRDELEFPAVDDFELSKFSRHLKKYHYMAAFCGRPLDKVPKEIDRAFGKYIVRKCKNHGLLKLNRVQHDEWLCIRGACDYNRAARVCDWNGWK